MENILSTIVAPENVNSMPWRESRCRDHLLLTQQVSLLDFIGTSNLTIGIVSTAMNTDSQSNHFDDQGNARMVDVTEKPITSRSAVASVTVRMQPATLDQIRAGENKKGDVINVARLAAIGGVKQTPTLIPLCHGIPVESARVEFEFIDARSIECTCTVKTTARTGVEMEALTGCSVAALTIYDMCKSIDRAIEITDLRLLSKSGGQSGDFRRSVQ